MSLVNDRELLALASERAEDLFPVLNRRGFGPLLAVLAVVPGLYALVYRPFDAHDALWALRSLDVYTAADAAQVLDPGRTGPEAVLHGRPPLQNWLTALVMRVFGPSHPLSPVLVGYLATVALVAMFYVLCRRLGGPRYAFWGAVMAALHGPLLAQAWNPAAQSLPQALALVAFWGYFSHREHTAGRVSLRLLAGGIALGLCLLSGGMLAVVAAAVLLVSVLGVRGQTVRPRRSPTTAPERVWRGWSALQSLLVLFAVGLATGGWWLGWMTWRHGGDFWWGGLTISNGFARAADAAPAFLVFAAHEGVRMLGVLTCLSLLGLWLVARELVRVPESARRDRLVFLLAWTACALVGWLVPVQSEQFGNPLWQGFFVLACVALAAWAVEETARRQVHVCLVIGMSCATAIVLLWPALEQTATRLLWSEALWLGAAAFVVIVLAGWWLLRFFRSGDANEQLVLIVLLLTLLAGNAAAGLVHVRQDDANDRVLDALREELSDVDDVEAWTLIAAEPPPLPLWWVLRSLWPEAAWRTPVESWDAALSQALSDSPRPWRKLIVVDWSDRETRPTQIAIRGLQIKQITDPLVLRRRPLRAYSVIGGR